MPFVSKRSPNVAKLCVTEMNKHLESVVGKKANRDYVKVLEKYLIPFLERCMSHVSAIKRSEIVHWRKQQEEQ